MVKRLYEGTDTSTYGKIKQKVLNFIEDTTKKSCTLCSLHDRYSFEDIYDIYNKLIEDEDILQALQDYEFIGKLKQSSNRYAQALPDLKMEKVRSKKGKSGWSSWTK